MEKIIHYLSCGLVLEAIDLLGEGTEEEIKDRIECMTSEEILNACAMGLKLMEDHPDMFEERGSSPIDFMNPN